MSPLTAKISANRRRSDTEEEFAATDVINVLLESKRPTTGPITSFEAVIYPNCSSSYERFAEASIYSKAGIGSA